MSKRGYLEGLDDALLLISDDKLQDSVAVMITQHTACLKKLGEKLGVSRGLRFAAGLDGVALGF
jgi:hypothetical protein